MTTAHWFHLDSTPAGVVLGVILVAFLFVQIRARILNPSRLSVFNDRKWLEFGYTNARQRYIDDPEGLIRSGLQQGGDAFFLYTHGVPCLVLGPRYADVIRNDERLDLGEFLGGDFHGGIPGFEPLANMALRSKIIQTTVKKKLSRETPKLVGPLSAEAKAALERNWTEEPEWHQANLKKTMGQIVAQMVSRGFLGDADLVRNPTWLGFIYHFLEELFLAAHILLQWPVFMRRLVSWFIPSYRKTRIQIQEATQYLQPLLDEANSPDSDTKSASQKDDDSPTNALRWLRDASKGREYDYTTLLVTLLLASLDTSTDLLTKVVCDLSDNPEVVHDLRKEIIEVVGKEGLTRSSIPKLYLLDSAMKETQRLRPLGYVSMQRLAKEKVVLPDGIIIPKGTSVMVSACHMMDSSVWPNGDKYDGYRFANLRKKGDNTASTSHQLTTTSPDHLGFGYGKQACPGRHYAAMFGKIALCHILLKYDFDVITPEEGRIDMRGHSMLPSTNIKVNLRRRKEEIVL